MAHLITSLVTLALVAAGLVFFGPQMVHAWAASHDRAVLTAAHDTAQGGALTAGTADAGQVASACLRATQRARAGGYASAKADAAPPPADGSRRTYDGAAFMNQIGGQ